jgi:hypothetical protein
MYSTIRDENFNNPKNWFEHATMGKDLVRIWERHAVRKYKTNAWFVRGSRWNLLVDTGHGVSNLAEYIEHWVNRPLTAVATSADVSVAGGLFHFPDTGMCLSDVETIDSAFGKCRAWQVQTAKIWEPIILSKLDAR